MWKLNTKASKVTKAKHLLSVIVTRITLHAPRVRTRPQKEFFRETNVKQEARKFEIS